MRTHHCEKMPMAIDGLTDVLMPTDRKHEYWRMMGVLKFSNNLALGQMYHWRNVFVSPPGRGVRLGRMDNLRLR